MCERDIVFLFSIEGVSEVFTSAFTVTVQTIQIVVAVAVKSLSHICGVFLLFLSVCDFVLIHAERKRTGRWQPPGGHPWQCVDRRREERCRRGALPNTAGRRGPREQNQKSPDTGPDTSNQQANLQVKKENAKKIYLPVDVLSEMCFVFFCVYHLV